MVHQPWLLALLIIALTTGCSRATPIPEGAQVVKVVITASDVRLDPTIVRPGEVYLVLEAPEEGSFAFVERKAAADATAGPLSEDALARVMRGRYPRDRNFRSRCRRMQRSTERSGSGPARPVR
jgi:hypothetical protein